MSSGDAKGFTLEAEANLFRQFMALHPNNEEPFNPTDENVKRWKWHIKNHEDQKTKALGVGKWRLRKNEDFEAWKARRRVTEWNGFDILTKAVFVQIARCFIGPVFACGSRVVGDYIEPNDPPEVREWRAQAGKTDKQVSDFDVFMTKDTRQIIELPPMADVIRHGVPDSEKILISVEQWDFSKLPESEHARVVELFKAGAWKELIDIHDRYNLSPYTYCCEIEGLKAWYRWAIGTELIKSGE